jgi:hypothetical protein
MTELFDKPELCGYLALTLEAAHAEDRKSAFSDSGARISWCKHKEIEKLMKHYSASSRSRWLHRQP